MLLKWKGGVVEEDGGVGVQLSSLRAEEGYDELLGGYPQHSCRRPMFQTDV